MRIAHVMKVNNIAGAENHLLHLLPGLKQRHLDIHFVMLVEPDQPMDEMVARLEKHRIHVQRVKIHRHADAGVYVRLLRLLQKLKPDIVHTHLIHGDLFGIPTAKLIGKPVVTSRHDDSGFRRRRPIRMLNAFLWWLANQGIAISHALAGFSIRVEGAHPNKVNVVHYGIPHESPSAQDIQNARDALRNELHIAAGSELVGMVCRLIPLKEVDTAIRAFARIAPEFPDLHMVIAGDGPEKDNLCTLARSLRLESRVHFLGWRGDIPEVMAALDVLLVTSSREGFGLVILEAMSRRVPVIATAISALPEVVDANQTGLLVPLRDPAATAEALRFLLVDRPLRAHMGLLGEDRLETQFSVSRMVDETIAVYRKILRR